MLYIYVQLPRLFQCLYRQQSTFEWHTGSLFKLGQKLQPQIFTRLLHWSCVANDAYTFCTFNTFNTLCTLCYQITVRFHHVLSKKCTWWAVASRKWLVHSLVEFPSHIRCHRWETHPNQKTRKLWKGLPELQEAFFDNFYGSSCCGSEIHIHICRRRGQMLWFHPV